MYCLQWLIPVLLIPKPLNPALLSNHVMFMVLYLTGFFLERKPCTICSVVFLIALFLICSSGYGNCLFWGTADPDSPDVCSSSEEISLKSEQIIMKINERTLMSYSTSSTSPTDKEGFLWKRGEVNKNFQKRYFVLKGNLLFYFEKKGDKDPIGVIILEGSTIELAEEEQEKFAFKIVFHGEGRRSYVLGTDHQELLEEWMKLLACASYDYMKLMVMELQQQLSELEEAERLQQLQQPNELLVGVDNRRMNPFNSTRPEESKTGTLIDISRGPKKSWAAIHLDFGGKISKDREAWCRQRQENNLFLLEAK